MEAFTFAVSTQVDFPIHIKMYVSSLGFLDAVSCIERCD